MVPHQRKRVELLSIIENIHLSGHILFTIPITNPSRMPTSVLASPENDTPPTPITDQPIIIIQESPALDQSIALDRRELQSKIDEEDPSILCNHDLYAYFPDTRSMAAIELLIKIFPATKSANRDIATVLQPSLKTARRKLLGEEISEDYDFNLAKIDILRICNVLKPIFEATKKDNAPGMFTNAYNSVKSGFATVTGWFNYFASLLAGGIKINQYKKKRFRLSLRNFSK